ncbi:integrase catalytic region protein, partial [Schaalia cardiffensis F0333]
MHVMLNRSEAAAHHGAGHVARCTVERLMRAMSISGIRRAKSPNTTRSTPKDQCPMDRVNRHFAALAPNILWVADITYVKTHAGWVYVAFVTDVYSRRILGWQTSTSLYTDLALDALKMAIWRRRRDGADLTGLIHHSDRGVQYTAIRYGQALADCDAVSSVGSKGDSYDNALAEALNSLYKAELVRNKGPWNSIDDLEIATAQWVHWYNTIRPHFRDQHAHPRRTRERSHPTPAGTDQTPHPPKGSRRNQMK